MPEMWRGGSSPSCGLDWMEFRIGDLFEKLPSKFLAKGDKFKYVSKSFDDVFCVPLLYAKRGDNGVMYWAKKGDF